MSIRLAVAELTLAGTLSHFQFDSLRIEVAVQLVQELLCQLPRLEPLSDGKGGVVKLAAVGCPETVNLVTNYPYGVLCIG
jgi:hypothetical protein